MKNEKLIKRKMKNCIKNISKRVLKLSSEQHKNLNLGSNENQQKKKTENATRLSIYLKGETKEKKTLCNKIQWRSPTHLGLSGKLGPCTTLYLERP